MINFLIKYWLEFLLTSLATTILCVLKQYGGIKNGMVALLRNEIIRIYEKYTKLGYCPSYMKENTCEMYESYHKLGGNGMITTMVNEIYKLPSEMKGNEMNNERYFN